ncbi:MAG: glycosyltransferase family 2 protein [Catalinimonas sp.]
MSRPLVRGDVAVVILNWNGRTLLARFLPAVVAHSAGCRVVVADNASTDDSVAYVQQTFPEVEVVQLPRNLGYAGGYNAALRQIDAPLYVLLNSDVEVTAGWVDPVLHLLNERSHVAAVQPKLLDYQRRDHFEYAGAGGGHLDRLGYPFCRGRIFETVERDRGQYDDVAEVFWASGACMFVRAGAFRAAGGFDEGFFAHMEEIDLCWRLKRLGASIFYQGESVVYHVGGGTLTRGNPRKTFLNFRNSLLMLLKNLPAREVLPVVLLRMVLDAPAAGKFLADGMPRDAWAVLRAHADFYKKIPRYLSARRGTFGRRTGRSSDGRYPGSIVWAYWAGGFRRYAELSGKYPTRRLRAEER